MAFKETADCECAVQAGDILGETPRWCERTQTLWWVDVRRPALQSYHPSSGKHAAIRLHPDLVTGSISLCEDGRLLLATPSGVYAYDPRAALAPELLDDPLQGQAGVRLNDGRCDRRGRFWVGSMHDTQRVPVGRLFRLEAGQGSRSMLDDIVVPNSICWSPDDKTMYFADTHQRLIWAFDYDIDEGSIRNRRVFQDWGHQPGLPDGSITDADGCVWTCMIVTGQLIRSTPQGAVDRVVQLPVTNPTCAQFGGSGLDTLFITTHSLRLSPEEQAREPLAGALLAFRPGVQGLPEARYAIGPCTVPSNFS